MRCWPRPTTTAATFRPPTWKVDPPSASSRQSVAGIRACRRAFVALGAARFASAGRPVRRRRARSGASLGDTGSVMRRTLHVLILRRGRAGSTTTCTGHRPRARVSVTARAPVRARARLLARRACRRGSVPGARGHAPRPVGLARRRAMVREHLPARGDLRDHRRPSRPQPALYDLVLPYAARNAVAVPEFALDSSQRTLGILATSLGRFDDADQHFLQAAAMNERMAARPWVAQRRSRTLACCSGAAPRATANRQRNSSPVLRRVTEARYARGSRQARRARPDRDSHVMID